MFSPVLIRVVSSRAVIAAVIATAPAAVPTDIVANSLASSRNSSFFAVKSVSARTSMIEALAGWITIAMQPSPAARSVRVSIFPLRRSRKSASAFARSPPDSTSALRQSPKPSPVEFRSAMTTFASIFTVSIMFSFTDV